MLARQGACSFLLPADAESPVLLATICASRSGVLEVSHHGSGDAGSSACSRGCGRASPSSRSARATPTATPSPATLATLARAGVPVRRTDLEGDISLACEAAG